MNSFTYLRYNFVDKCRKNACDVFVIGIRDRVIMEMN